MKFNLRIYASNENRRREYINLIEKRRIKKEGVKILRRVFCPRRFCGIWRIESVEVP